MVLSRDPSFTVLFLTLAQNLTIILIWNNVYNPIRAVTNTMESLDSKFKTLNM